MEISYNKKFVSHFAPMLKVLILEDILSYARQNDFMKGIKYKTDYLILHHYFRHIEEEIINELDRISNKKYYGYFNLMDDNTCIDKVYFTNFNYPFILKVKSEKKDDTYISHMVLKKEGKNNGKKNRYKNK